MDNSAMDSVSLDAEVPAVEAIRARFPAMKRHHNGWPVAYFDGPGGTQVPASVADSVSRYLLHHNANTHWAYPTSEETDRILEQSRRTLATFLNAEPTEIAFGQNMTTLTFRLARALGRQWGAGREIVVTDLDHNANIDSWHDVARQRKLRIRTVRFDPTTGQLNGDDLVQCLSSRTALVAIGGASNALGTINDIPRITQMARDVGALSFVDAVHYAPHVLCDVKALGCDFLVCSPYKFYGPHLGMLYGRHELLSALDVPRISPAPTHAPESFETGTLSHEAITGAAASVEFLASLAHGDTLRERLTHAFNALHRRAAMQARHLWDSLKQIPAVTLYGPEPDLPRTPTISFTVDGLSSKEVCRQLSHRGLFLSHGDFYAQTVVRCLGIEGLVRAGCACYTTDAEIERLIAGIQAIRN
ncbi:MAG: cysteine desulfurase-like protein [Bacteroidota bacterium]|nr:cysteine desulfurase-like protein [Bacteroidota bacterium]